MSWTRTSRSPLATALARRLSRSGPSKMPGKMVRRSIRTRVRLLARSAPGRVLVDRDVAPAVGREGTAIPSAPALAEPQPRQTGHEIDLRRPRVPELDGQEADSRVVELQDH